jgi:hypothetical protein
MYEAYVVYTGQVANTVVPGGPWPGLQAANQALAAFAQAQHGGWAQMIALIDAYGLAFQGGNAAMNVHVPTKP